MNDKVGYFVLRCISEHRVTSLFPFSLDAKVQSLTNQALRGATSASSGNLLEKQIIGLYPRFLSSNKPAL